MELDDLKNTWEDVSNQAEKQQNLTTKIIDQMTQTKYYSKLKKIAYPEIIGVIICLIGASFIVLNFYKLDSAFLQVVGILAILLLLTLSIISIISLRQFNMPRDVNKTYAETLKKFAIQKIRFNKLQRVNITLSYLLWVTIIILLSKLFDGQYLTDNKYFWTFSFALGYIFLLFFSKWVLKKYNNTLQQAEELLKELES